MRPVVTVRDLSRTYRLKADEVDALVDVAFTLEAGSLTALAGPSGSGKTTLMNLLAGWDRPDRGSAEVDDAGSVRGGWNQTAVVPQGIGLLPELTLLQNVELPGRFGNGQVWPAGVLMEELGLLGLESRMPGEVSVGEQQRAAVARAAAADPVLLLADEPTAHQDEENAARVMTVLSRCSERGSAVLISTHDERVLPWVDGILSIQNGRVRREPAP